MVLPERISGSTEWAAAEGEWDNLQSPFRLSTMCWSHLPTSAGKGAKLEWVVDALVASLPNVTANKLFDGRLNSGSLHSGGNSSVTAACIGVLIPQRARALLGQATVATTVCRRRDLPKWELQRLKETAIYGLASVLNGWWGKRYEWQPSGKLSQLFTGLVFWMRVAGSSLVRVNFVDRTRFFVRICLTHRFTHVPPPSCGSLPILQST